MKYNEPEMEILLLNTIDIITASGDDIIDEDDNNHGWVPRT